MIRRCVSWYWIPRRSIFFIKLSSGYNLAHDAVLLIRLDGA